MRVKTPRARCAPPFFPFHNSFITLVPSTLSFITLLLLLFLFFYYSSITLVSFFYESGMLVARSGFVVIVHSNVGTAARL